MASLITYQAHHLAAVPPGWDQDARLLALRAHLAGEGYSAMARRRGCSQSMARSLVYRGRALALKLGLLT